MHGLAEAGFFVLVEPKTFLFENVRFRDCVACCRLMRQINQLFRSSVRRVFPAGVVVALLAFPDLRAAEEGPSGADLSGEWKIVSIESGGETKTGSAITLGKVKFDKTKLYLGEGEFSFVMNYKVDTTKKPHPVVLSIASSPFGADETPHDGLVELIGDQLRLIYAKPGEAAPKNFEAPAGKQYRSMVLKRVKES